MPIHEDKIEMLKIKREETAEESVVRWNSNILWRLILNKKSSGDRLQFQSESDEEQRTKSSFVNVAEERNCFSRWRVPWACVGSYTWQYGDKKLLVQVGHDEHQDLKKLVKKNERVVCLAVLAAFSSFHRLKKTKSNISASWCNYFIMWKLFLRAILLSRLCDVE